MTNINALPNFNLRAVLKLINELHKEVFNLCYLSKKKYSYPNSLFLISRNSFPCRGFVNMSAVINSVGQYVIVNSPDSRYCLIKKYLNFMCFVRSEQDFPFIASLMVEVLSCIRWAWFTFMPSDCINCNSYAVSEVASDRVTSSDSVELLHTIFCFADFASIVPLPCDIMIPEWDLPLL